MEKFKLINLANFKGYINKADITNVGADYLVTGSQNVVYSDEGRIGTRQGFTLFGQADNSLEPILATYNWKTARGVEVLIRGRKSLTNDGTLEICDPNTNQFVELINNIGIGNFNFTTYWDTTEAQDALIFVCGDSNLYYWSGGITTYASSTADTITKEGLSSWAEDGFLTAGTRKVIINGVEYTYTGGETTTTLTGVTPSPVGAGHTAGDITIQAVRVTSNTPSATLKNDLIATYQNQIYIGSLTRRDIYISEVGVYTNFTLGTVPRPVGTPALLTLNETPTAFIEHNETMFISTYNQWYFVKFQLSDDLQNEDISIQLYDSLSGGGAINQQAVVKSKQDIVFISNEKIIDSLSRFNDMSIESVSEPLSEPIKLEIENYNITQCSAYYHKNFLYFSFPREGKVLIYNIYKGFWEAPQILPCGVMIAHKTDLYINSNVINETYKLFDGFNDNGFSMEAKAVFPYLNYGITTKRKGYTEWFTEGYISSNTVINMKVILDYKGYSGEHNYIIAGDDQNIVVSSVQSGNLGKTPLGKEPLGSSTTTIDDLKKFRKIQRNYKIDVFEMAIEYSSNNTDQRWFLINQGANAMISTADAQDIK
jgi:hypothetical protein